MAPLRVMYLNPGGQVGGAEASLLELMAALRRSQPEWSLHLIAAGDGPLATRASALGVTVTVLPFPGLLARIGESGTNGSAFAYGRLLAGLCLAAPETNTYRARLRRVVSAFGPDVLHTNGLKMHLLGTCCGGSAAVIWHLHDYVSSRPITSRFLSQRARHCRMAIANSISVARDAESYFRGRPSVQLLYNAVDLTRFSADGPRLNLDRLCGLPPGEPDTIRVGLVGSFARWKGHRVFIEALSLLPRHLAIRGYVIGGSIYQTAGSQHSVTELQDLARQLGVSSRIGFTGYVEQPEAALRSLDIVVHASTQPEPFGLVIAEAMACGRSVIVSAIGGAAELVHDSVDAIVHPAGDASALSARILTLATDADLRARLGRAARTTIVRRFDGDRLAAKIVPLYRHALGQFDESRVFEQPAAAR